VLLTQKLHYLPLVCTRVNYQFNKDNISLYTTYRTIVYFYTIVISIVLVNMLCAIIRGKKGFTSKRIVLFSNVCHEFGDDQLDDIIGSLKEAEIEFDVM